MAAHPTIIDVAREAGVSKSTVSRVLRGSETSVSAKTRENVWVVIKELGYEHNAVASSLRTNMVRLCESSYNVNHQVRLMHMAMPGSVDHMPLIIRWLIIHF